jgi:hypothetical protein
MYICVHTNRICSRISNQLTTTAERDFVRKHSKKLTVLRFSYTPCVYQMRYHSIWMVSRTDIKAEFGAVSYLKKLPNIRGSHQRLHVIWHDERSHHWTFFFQGATVTSHLYLDMEELHSATIALWCNVPAGWSAPTIWKQCLSAFKLMLSKKWTGRGGFLAWPPRSLDLTPVNFLLWGYGRRMSPMRRKCRSSNYARSHNRGDCNSDCSYACENKA